MESSPYQSRDLLDATVVEVRPDSRRLPKSWEVFYGTAEPGTVRGGFKGHRYDDVRRAFDARQAAALGMRNAA